MRLTGKYLWHDNVAPILDNLEFHFRSIDTDMKGIEFPEIEGELAGRNKCQTATDTTASYPIAFALCVTSPTSAECHFSYGLGDVHRIVKFPNFSRASRFHTVVWLTTILQIH